MEWVEKTIELAHCETQAVSAGKGATATVATSGGLQGGYEWSINNGLSDRLAEIGLFVAWNRRMFRDARGPFCIQSLETNAIDLMRVLDLYSLGEANLMGTSFGTSTSLTAAFWFPHRVRKLVLMQPTRITNPGGDETIMNQVKKFREMVLEHGVEQAVQMEGFCYKFSPDRSDLEGGTVSDTSAEDFAIMVEESYRRFGTGNCTVLGMPAAMLRRIKHPALIIPGDDPVHPAQCADELARQLPNGRIARTPRGDEKLMPQALIEEVVEFLQA